MTPCPQPGQRRFRPESERGAASSQPTTARQRQALAVILTFTRTHNYPPTFRDLGEALGIRSTNGVADLVHVLEGKRCLTYTPKQSRTLVLTAAGEEGAEQHLREHGTKGGGHVE